MNKNRKDYADLSVSGKRARDNKYEAKRQELGVTNVLANLVKDPVIRDNKDGSKSAYVTLAVNVKGEKTQFFDASAYIAEGKDSLLNFYSNSLKKGHLVSVDYKVSGKFTNIYELMSREEAYRANQAEKAQEQEQVPAIVVN